MSNLASLKPFQKGHDPRRNTKGRFTSSKDKTLRTYLLEYLNKKVEFKGKKRKMVEILAERIVDQAMKGDLKAIKFIIERIDGKPRTKEAWMEEPVLEEPLSPERLDELDKVFGRDTQSK